MRAIQLPIGDIDDVMADRMFALFAPYYAGVSPERFRRDLHTKDFAILLWHGDTLAGFTTVGLSRFPFEGRERAIIFSGDTIVARAHWGEQALAVAWIGALARLVRAAPGVPFYWFLIVKGHRTFRYLPTFVRRFVPHWGEEDAALVRLRDALAAAMFGAAYDPATGVIRFAEPRGQLAPAWAQPTAREAARGDVAFFLARNPGFAQGDELACLCAIDESNMRPLTRRLFRAALAE